jgi:hypothetical protein
MTWLQPWAAWLLAGLPLIVLLYLLKVRRQPVRVSTLMFWQRVLEEHRRRALFQRLRHVLSLLLWLLIAALIVAALARPTLDRLVREGSATVLILDARARMQATEADGQTRWEKARRRALRTVQEASAGRQFAVIALGPQPQVLAPFTGNERTLREAIEKAQVTDATGDLAPAQTLADSLLATRGGAKQTVLLSGGIPRDNVAILRFATRPLPASPQTSEVFLELANFGASEVKANLELRYDDRLIDVRPVTLGPGAREVRVFPSVPRPTINARGQLTARLDVADALAHDNTAYATLPPPRPVRVLLISRGNVFLEKALAAEAGASYELLAPEVWTPAIGVKFDAVVFDDFVPPDWPGVNALFIGRTPFDAPGDPLDAPVLTDFDASHPLVRLLDFAQTTILRARALALPEPSDDWTYAAPLRSFDHPLLVAGESRGEKRARVAALGLDLTATDLPLRVAFPLLISNALHWLAASAPDPLPPLRCGDVLPLSPGEAVNTEPPATAFFQPLRNGFYPLVRESRTQWLAVNTAAEAESDLRTASSSKESPVSAPAADLPFFPGWPIWRYLALAALALTAGEWALFHRRRTE